MSVSSGAVRADERPRAGDESPGDRAADVSRRRISGSRIAVILAVVAIAPIVVAVAVASSEGWRPLGDDAAISVISHDVFSSDTPLVGMPSTVGDTADTAFEAHHPGPLLFWALAVPERLAGSAPIGILIGVALVNAAAIATIVVVTRRLAGVGAAMGAAALVVVLMWALGRQTIVSPWNPFISVLPLVALFVLTWAVLAGRSHHLWAVALAASFVAQAHMLYVPLAVVSLACATLAVVADLVRRARRRTSVRREALTVAASTLVTLAVTWSFPIVEQLTNSPGNFREIDRSIGANPGDGLGNGYALRVLVETLGFPPLFARQGAALGKIAPELSQIGALRVVGAIIVVALLVAGTAVAARRRDRTAAAAGSLAMVLVVTTGLVAARVATVFTFFGVPQYRLLQCWAAGCFVWLATGFTIVRAVAPLTPRLGRRRVRAIRAVAAVAAITVLAVMPVAIAYADSDGRADIRVARAVDQLADDIVPQLERETPYLMQFSADWGFEGFSTFYGLARELIRRGVDVRVGEDDPYLSESHAAPKDADRIMLTVGRNVGPPAEPGTRKLADFVSATPDDVDEFERAVEVVRAHLRDESLLTDLGRKTLDNPRPDDPKARSLSALYSGEVDPVAMLESNQIGDLWLEGLLSVETFEAEAFREYADARRVVEGYRFGAYLVP